MTPNRRDTEVQAQTRSETDLLQLGYQVLGELGEGAFGTVVKAKDIASDKLVAIKVIPKKHLGKGELLKVHLEVQSMKALDHPNIVQLLDFKETDSGMYIVLEYCSKGDLLTHVQSKERLSESEALVLFRHLVNGMDYAHKKNVIHRDIKLENLLLAQDGSLKIADWGFARSWSPDSLIKGEYPGSLHYASPEIVTATPYSGPEVDIWSMGVTLYGICSGCLPFFGNNDEIIVDRIKTSTFPLFHTFSKDLKDLLTHMLDYNSTKRFTIEQIKNHPWVSCRVKINGISRIRSRSFVAEPQGKPMNIPALNLLDSFAKITADENIVVTPKGIITHRSILFDKDVSSSSASSSSSSDSEHSSEENVFDTATTNSKKSENNNNNTKSSNKKSPKINANVNSKSPTTSPLQQRKNSIGSKKLMLLAPLLKLIGKGSPKKESSSPSKQGKPSQYLNTNKEAFSSPYI
eukprot:TRINITY_DN757_c0_g3_i1.p1 TRINITY_DN757_c0_g3~~TRINITY_DN757_c0_g3_i1.p1  ORF type:complete len:494 (-),score=143.03 TRINITY_DN757_c0_g3_i1:281-1666(-)